MPWLARSPRLRSLTSRRNSRAACHVRRQPVVLAFTIAETLNLLEASCLQTRHAERVDGLVAARTADHGDHDAHR